MADATTGVRGDPRRRAPSPPLPPDALIIVPVRGMVLFPGVVLPVTLGRPRSVLAAQQAVREQKPIGVVDAAQRRGRRSRCRSICIGWGRSPTSFATSPRLTAPIISSARASSGSGSLDYLTGWPFFVAKTARIPEPAADVRRDRSPLRSSQGPGDRGDRSSCRKRPTNCWRRSRASIRPARSPTWWRPSWTRPPTRSKKSSRRSTSARRMDGSRDCSRIGSRCCACRRRSAGRPRRRSTRAIARSCCASRWRPFSASLARPMRASQPRSPNSNKAITNAQHAEGGRGPGAQGTAPAASACRRPPANTAWCAPISTGWSNCPGRCPRRRRSTLPRRAASSTRIISAWKRSSAGSSNISPFASSRPTGKAPILCFVGPPGVGKTSLGQSIARAMGRKFVRVSLGGVHDEAEIRGHRRTYIGALPGNIIQAIRKAGARDCVMMLDEIDKLGAGIQGDPASAHAGGARSRAEQHLPRQLSRRAVRPQSRRLHRHRQHARHHPRPASRPHGDHQPRRLHRERKAADRAPLSRPRQLEANGLKPGQVEIADDALRGDHRALYARGRACAASSARSAGRCAMPPCGSPRARRGPITIDAGDLVGILGPPRFENEVAMRTSMPGVATGLAWTPVGGDILFIEATAIPGSGRLILTGQLGDVMKESAQAALSIVKSRAALARHRSGAFEKTDIHIHVPAARRRRTARAPGSPCSWRWSRC